MNFLDLTALFCNIDDFCGAFIHEWEKQLLASGVIQRRREKSLCLSEIITILVMYHASGFQCFKLYYNFLLRYRRDEFPQLVSYTRFIELVPGALIPLCAYLNTRRAKATGISFIDSTSIAVCKNKRIERNKVFAGLAKRGKTSMGWFFGFKAHLVINERGELLSL